MYISRKWITGIVMLVSAVLDGINWIFIYCIAVILIVYVIMDKDPKALLVGLSVFAAVLMLIFKDSILGSVVGVQLIVNRVVKSWKSI